MVEFKQFPSFQFSFLILFCFILQRDLETAMKTEKYGLKAVSQKILQQVKMV